MYTYAPSCSTVLMTCAEEAIATFQEAIAADANCAMAWWGIAYGVSSNYNWPPGLGSGFDAITVRLRARARHSTVFLPTVLPRKSYYAKQKPSRPQYTAARRGIVEPHAKKSSLDLVRASQ